MSLLRPDVIKQYITEIQTLRIFLSMGTTVCILKKWCSWQLVYFLGKTGYRRTELFGFFFVFFFRLTKYLSGLIMIRFLESSFWCLNLLYFIIFLGDGGGGDKIWKQDCFWTLTKYKLLLQSTAKLLNCATEVLVIMSFCQKYIPQISFAFKLFFNNTLYFVCIL